MSRPAFIGAALALSAGATALIMTRGVRLLGFDGYWYLNLAIDFSSRLPDHIGNYYAFGYPLIASLAIRSGAEPFIAQSCLSWLSLLICCLAYSKAADLLATPAETRKRLWGLAAVVMSPAVLSLTLATMSEMTFAGLLALATLMLARTRNALALAAAGLSCVLAFTVRYAGIFMLAVLAIVALRSYVIERDKRILSYGLGIALSCAAAILWMLFQNRAATGYWGGGERAAGAVSGGDVVSHIADFGWAFPGLFMGGMTDSVRALAPNASMVIGVLIVAGLMIYCARIILDGDSDGFSVAAALVVMGYSTALIALRSISAFDGLSATRFAVPVAFQVAWLLAGAAMSRHARALVVILSCASIALGLFQAFRGTSAQIYADISDVVPTVRALAKPGDRILALGQAAGIAAYLPKEVRVVMPGNGTDPRTVGFVLVSAVSKDRLGSSRYFDEDARRLVESLTESKQFLVLASDDKKILLQRKRPMTQSKAELERHPS